MKPDHSQAVQFAQAITGQIDPCVTIQTFDDCKGLNKQQKSKPNLTRIITGRISELEAELVRMNNAGAGIFILINESDGKGRKKENIRGVRALFVDNDDGELPERLHLDPTIRVRTKNGEHVYWCLDPFANPKVFTEAQNCLIKKYGTDKSVKDAPRVMRLPGYFHLKDPSAPFLVKMKVIEAQRKYEISRVIDGIKADENPFTDDDKGPSDDEFIREGGRNEYLFSKMGHFRGRGFDREETRKILKSINKKKCIPPLSDEEVDQIMKSFKEMTFAEKTLFAPFTDLGNAERFVSFCEGRVLFNANSKKWMLFRGTHFVEDAEANVIGVVKKMYRHLRCAGANFVDDNGVSFAKHIQKSENKQRIEAMLALAQADLSRTHDSFDRDAFKFNVLNGTIDLKSGRLNPHSRDDLITKVSKVRFDPTAKAPNFMRFLSEVTGGSEEVSSYLQRVFGYCMVGSPNSEQSFWVLYGSGDNGKTTLLELVKKVFGPYSATTGISTFTLSRSEGVRNDLARLVGSRFVTAAETQEGRALDESTVKLITGGEPIVCRYLFKEYFEYVPTWKFFLAVNHLPQITGSDHGIWKRIKVVPFKTQIPKERIDRLLPQKLESELPGVLNWMIEGCLKWQNDGLKEPAAVSSENLSYRQSQDSIDDFLAEYTVRDPQGTVGATELMMLFAKLQKDLGQPVLSQKTFTQKLALKDIPTKRSTGGRVVYVGIRQKRTGDKRQSE